MVDKELAHCYRLSPEELACHEAFPGEAEAFLTQELQRSLGETLGGPQECPTKQVGLLNASCILAQVKSLGPHNQSPGCCSKCLGGPCRLPV